MPERIVFIRDAGAALTTRNVLERRAPVRWLDRGPSRAPADNGWRVFSAADSSVYLENRDNWKIVEFNDLCAIEPALIAVYDMPIGTRLELVHSEGERYFVDSTTGERIASRSDDSGTS